MNLYIIGNGFDVAHGLSTKYIDFRNYLKKEDWEYLVQFEAPYNCFSESRRDLNQKYLWREFESNLSDINEAEIINNCMLTERQLNSVYHKSEDALYEYCEKQYQYVRRLNDYIKAWIEQIEIQVPKKTFLLNRDRDDLFITFNYTTLLERIYQIDPNQILHIHGSVNKEDDFPPVIGHGNAYKIQQAKEKASEASEKLLEKQTSVYHALENYYTRTLKDVNYFINIHSQFFNRLKTIKQVNVIGHSFGNVDLPYFKKILGSIQENAVWNVYYHSNNEIALFRDKIISVGVSSEQIKMLPSSEFFHEMKKTS